LGKKCPDCGAPVAGLDAGWLKRMATGLTWYIVLHVFAMGVIVTTFGLLLVIGIMEFGKRGNPHSGYVAVVIIFLVGLALILQISCFALLSSAEPGRRRDGFLDLSGIAIRAVVLPASFPVAMVLPHIWKMVIPRYGRPGWVPSLDETVAWILLGEAVLIFLAGLRMYLLCRRIGVGAIMKILAWCELPMCAFLIMSFRRGLRGGGAINQEWWETGHGQMGLVALVGFFASIAYIAVLVHQLTKRAAPPLVRGGGIGRLPPRPRRAA
jgi:hypothetical protein